MAALSDSGAEPQKEWNCGNRHDCPCCVEVKSQVVHTGKQANTCGIKAYKQRSTRNARGMANV
jgi:hypothetical protein